MSEIKRTCKAYEYMDQAETLLREIFKNRSDLEILREKRPFQGERRGISQDEVDTVLVDLINKKGSNTLILETSMNSNRDFVYSKINFPDGYSSSRSTFRGGFAPLQELEDLANKVLEYYS